MALSRSRGWAGRYEHLDHEVRAARQLLNEALTGASMGVVILRPADLPLTPEAVRVMIGSVVETPDKGRGEARDCLTGGSPPAVRRGAPAGRGDAAGLPVGGYTRPERVAPD